MAKPSKPSRARVAWTLIVCLGAALAWSMAMTPIRDNSQHNSAGAIRHHAKQIESALSE